MKRRKALKLTVGIMGTAIIGSEFFLSGCSRKDERKNLFSENDISLLNEVGEIILPKTERSPGAKNANIGGFMKDIVTDCYDTKEQDIFINGIIVINKLANKLYGNSLINLQPDQKFDLILKLDREAKQKKDTTHFFRMIKELTIWGYFTSEPGATIALRYNPIPGKFIGCVRYSKGDKAWA